jgi:hypothetical protein
MRAKNRADASLSRAGTIVWWSSSVMVSSEVDSIEPKPDPAERSVIQTGAAGCQGFAIHG